MKIQIKVKSVYGVERIYPVNDTAVKFGRLVGTKTFTKEQLKIIKDLGYEIEEVYAYPLTETKEFI